MNKLYASLCLAAALVLAPAAKADSITYESHVGNTYTYDLTLDNHNTLFLFDGFTLSGLSGITGASLSGELGQYFDITYFDATTVDVGTAFAYIHESGKLPVSIGTLTLTSTSTAGLADFFILDSNGSFEGTVTGPTTPSNSPVPEPSTLAMMGTGLLAAAGAARRKFLS